MDKRFHRRCVAIILTVLVAVTTSQSNSIDWSTAVVDKCTTIIVAKGAGRDGPMVRIMAYKHY